MTPPLPDRWRQLSELYHAALTRDGPDRPAFIAEACVGDDALRHEIESLLEYDDAADTRSSFNGLQGAAKTVDEPHGSFAGRQFGSYQLVELLGAGGMGEVYSAHDPRLRRDVAIKVVRAALAADPERFQRLQREARVAAAMNHPNILAVHDIGTHEGIPYIVMERVLGETLAEQLARERPPLSRALDIGMQIADALAAAHARGILHRDLKPANVMLTTEGRVKVLDFGLAKMLATETAPTEAPTTRTSLMTRPGQIFGTPAYMAPEQLVGEPSDHRADIYSLGVILFELTAGRRPYEGHDFVGMALNKLAQPVPSPSDLDPSVPLALSQVISRCLAKTPSERPASAAALRSELERIRATVDAPNPQGDPSPSPVRHDWTAWTRAWPPSLFARRVILTAAAATALALTAAAIGWRMPVTDAPAERPIVAVLPLANLTGQNGNEYLGIGIADALTTSLSRLSSVSVVSRETARDSARTTSDPSRLARELGVNLLVQGSLQRSGDRLRVDAKLIKPDGTVVWAGDSEAMLSDLFTIQRQLSDRLVEALRVTISPRERQQLTAAATNNQDALEAYWRGMALLERTDGDAVDQAIGSLERAIALDPDFAVAQAGLGAAFVRKYAVTNDGAWMTRAEQAVTGALALDPTQTPGRLTLANVYRSTGRNGSAVDELRHVLADQPTNDEARRRLGAIFESEGRQAEALEQLRGAVALRPEYWRNHDDLGFFYFRTGHMPDAIRAFTRVVELRPDAAQSYQRLGTAYQAGGDKARARQNLEKAISITPDPASYSNLGTIHYSEGRFEEAARAYQAAIKLRPNRALYHRNLGDAYQKLGRMPEARNEYQQAVRLTEETLRVNPNDASTMANLAVYEAKVGRRSDAERHISRAIVINPSNPEILFQRGAVSALLGDPTAALEAVSGAVARGFGVDLVRDDDDLASLRFMPAFQSLIASAK
jgi:eukaryotic-like serine/threonine-protein kinase